MRVRRAKMLASVAKNVKKLVRMVLLLFKIILLRSIMKNVRDAVLAWAVVLQVVSNPLFLAVVLEDKIYR